MSQRFSRIFATFLLAVSAFAMLAVSFDAEARRMGGGRSFGKQSSNITQKRAPVTPPAASGAAQRSAVPAAGAASATAGAAAKTGMSRWLGPLAGIAAGLGIAALLSSMGLSGAFLEIISNLLMIGLLVFGVMFLIRRFRGGAAKSAMQHSGASPMQRQNTMHDMQAQQPSRHAETSSAAMVGGAAAAPAQPVDQSWFIPADFDTAAFLGTAKAQFHTIQAVWDSGNTDKLHAYLTDDLIAEMQQDTPARTEGSKTEVLLLNAELLGIEAVAGGHLASVRYSGMLREDPQAEAFRFEEVWNLYKADNAGWLLAGIQQLPVEQAN